MIGYIYKTTNLINGKIYIGHRKKSYFDIKYKGSGKYLWNAIHKYGWDNFKTEILVECNSDEELDSEEIRLIAEYDSTNLTIGYNLTKGGGGQLGYSPTEETREKLRKSSTGNKYFAGHTHSQEWKDNMSKKLAGQKFSEETRKKMSNSAKGRSMYKARMASIEARKGKPLPESAKLKISIANKGKKRSEETRKRISESRKGRTFHLSESARHKISLSNSRREISDHMRESISKSKSKYVYIYEGLEFYGWRKIRNYLRSIGYKRISQTSIGKLSSGKIVKGYEDLVGKITWRYCDED